MQCHISQYQSGGTKSIASISAPKVHLIATKVNDSATMNNFIRVAKSRPKRAYSILLSEFREKSSPKDVIYSEKRPIILEIYR